MRFEFFIAARYLRAKRREGVVGVITAIRVIGVAAGVASLIIALAITNGIRRDMQEKLVGSTAHVMLMRTAGDGIRNWRPLVERLRGLPHVTAAAPALYEEVLVAAGVRSGGAEITGIVPTEERTVSDILQSVKQGSASALEPVDPTHRDETAMNGAPGLSSTDQNQEKAVRAQAVPPIMIGTDLATAIGAEVGDTVQVISPQGELSPLGLVPRYMA